MTRGQLLPGLAVPLGFALAIGVAAGAGSFFWSSMLPGPLGSPTSCVLHGIAAALVVLAAAQLLQLWAAFRSVPSRSVEGTAWVHEVLGSDEVAMGLRAVADDPRSALSELMKRWNENICDRAGILSILAALLGGAWLLFFLMSIQGADGPPSKDNALLLFCGLVEALLVLGGAALLFWVGRSLFHAAEEAGIGQLNRAHPAEKPAPQPEATPAPQPRRPVPTWTPTKGTGPNPPPPPPDDDDSPPLPSD
jgi:hypothetical protein